MEAVDTIDGVSLRAFGTRTFDAIVALGPYYQLAHRLASWIGARWQAGWRAWLATERRSVVAFLPSASGGAGLLIRAAEWCEQVPLGTPRRALDEVVFVYGTRASFRRATTPRRTDPDELRSLFELLESFGFATRVPSR